MPNCIKDAICLISLILVLLLAACYPGKLAKVDANQKATFSGTLQFEMFYGAPGFGEDTTMDEKEPTYILHLSKPFLFRDTALLSGLDTRMDTVAYDTISTIHVRFYPESTIAGNNLRTLVGKKVTMECTLYGAITGHHHAPAITEQVYSIKE